MPPTLSCPACVWDGKRQLSGTLELWENEVVFKFDEFKNSHLNLIIPLTTIVKVEEYLVFDLAKNGLRIQNTDGKFDLFVLEEGQAFKKKLLSRIQ